MPVLDFAFIRAQRLEIGEKCNYQMGQVDKKENRDQLKSIQRKEADLVRDVNKNKKIETENEEVFMNPEAKRFMDEVPDEAFTGANNSEDE